MGEDLTMDIAVWALWIGGGGFTLIVLVCIAWGMWYDFFGRKKQGEEKKPEEIRKVSFSSFEHLHKIQQQLSQTELEYRRVKHRRALVKRKKPPLWKRTRYP